MRPSHLWGLRREIFGLGNLQVVVCGALLTAAVSYTHLRAHETVLDLVCRLLLEKNKGDK